MHHAPICNFSNTLSLFSLSFHDIVSNIFYLTPDLRLEGLQSFGVFLLLYTFLIHKIRHSKRIPLLVFVWYFFLQPISQMNCLLVA